MFGAWTTLPAGPAALAAKTGAPIVPRRDPAIGRRPDLRGRRTASRSTFASSDPAELHRATQAIADALAATIAAAPEQWYSFKPIWPATAGRAGRRSPNARSGPSATAARSPPAGHDRHEGRRQTRGQRGRPAAVARHRREPARAAGASGRAPRGSVVGRVPPAGSPAPSPLADLAGRVWYRIGARAPAPGAPQPQPRRALARGPRPGAAGCRAAAQRPARARSARSRCVPQQPRATTSSSAARRDHRRARTRDRGSCSRRHAIVDAALVLPGGSLIFVGLHLGGYRAAGALLANRSDRPAVRADGDDRRPGRSRRGSCAHAAPRACELVDLARSPARAARRARRGRVRRAGRRPRHHRRRHRGRASSARRRRSRPGPASWRWRRACRRTCVGVRRTGVRRYRGRLSGWRMPARRARAASG